MLRNRVIPVVLIDGFSVLKTIKFDQRRNLGSPVTVARTYNTRNVDELVLLDIDASKQGRTIDLFTIQDIAAEMFMPLTVGGGIRSLHDISGALVKGADKVAINTAALKNPDLITQGANRFGSQCIVVSIDVREVESQYLVFSHAGLSQRILARDWAKEVESRGAGEILLNNVDRDGQMSGIDVSLVKLIADSVSIPVIAAGGVKDPMDSVLAIESGASAVGAASIFHFTSFTPDDCKKKMADHGIPAREFRG
jgi:imidazole glycerol-phosphate synthase subunit HisF